MALKVRAVVRLLKFDQDKEWLMKLKKDYRRCKKHTFMKNNREKRWWNGINIVILHPKSH